MIFDNSAGWAACGGGGGGIYCYGGSPTIVGNLIVQNVAEMDCVAWGGGILCDNSAAIIANNTIVGNTAHSGGGIRIDVRYGVPPRQISNNTIVDNIAFRGSGICGYGVGDAAIVDCIVWSSADEYPIVERVSASYCGIKGGYPGEGNIDQDPMFAEGPIGGFGRYGHYYLDPDSPCIDAGSRSAEDAGLSGMTTQEDGTPDTGRVDMGSHYPLSNQH